MDLFLLAIIGIAASPMTGAVTVTVNNRQLERTSTDLTLVAGSSGVDVVDACIQKINSIPTVFGNDFGFLKRIALVESNFGANSPVVNGGIWQISSTIYAAIQAQNSNDLATFLNAAATVLPSNIVDFSSDDFSIPLRSALAARIYLQMQIQVGQGSLPGTVSDQATWWAANYNTAGSSSSFVTTVTSYETQNQCTVSKLDLWFLIDGSGSVGSSNFQTCLNFVDQTAAGFTISPDQVRTGLMVYSTSTFLISSFDQHTTNSQFSSAVLGTAYPSGGTLTGAAIAEVNRTGFNVDTGARPSSEGVPRVLIVLTDGQSFDNVTGPSDDIKQTGVTVFGVGVGSGFVQSEIHQIASDPDAEYSFEFTEFQQLSSILQNIIANQACSISAVIPDDTAIQVTIEATYYAQVQLPSTGSIELSYEMSASVTVYMSESATNPSSAIFDISFQLNVGISTVFVNSADVGPPQLVNRRKRQTTSSSIPLYIAFVPDQAGPVSMNFKSTGSSTRAVSTTTTTASGQSIHNIPAAWMMLLACFALLMHR